MSLQRLSNHLNTLQQEIEMLKTEGYIPYPAPFVLDSSLSDGKRYYRKRIRQWNGKPGESTQISFESYNELRAKVKRGKRIHKLQQQLNTIMTKIDAIAVVLKEMG
jgi:hypothetical protein